MEEQEQKNKSVPLFTVHKTEDNRFGFQMLESDEKFSNHDLIQFVVDCMLWFIDSAKDDEKKKLAAWLVNVLVDVLPKYFAPALKEESTEQNLTVGEVEQAQDGT